MRHVYLESSSKQNSRLSTFQDPLDRVVHQSLSKTHVLVRKPKSGEVKVTHLTLAKRQLYKNKVHGKLFEGV